MSSLPSRMAESTSAVGWLALALLALLMGGLACDREEAMHPGDAPRDAVEDAGQAAADAARASGYEIERATDAVDQAVAAEGSEAAQSAADAEARRAAEARQAAADAEREAKAAGQNAVKALEGTEYEQFNSAED
ncbi:MAG: hypothetical protein R3F35_20285 [Myxococcota bacterium]